jgi:hypothetical protein|tara:strand:+ start:105 stop:389 length:285 start_codon:yes stop_codon:yes gene_type:complete
MAKSFVEVPENAVRISVGERTSIVAWQSSYNGENQISLGRERQYQEGGDTYVKMAPPITQEVFYKLVTLANGHLFQASDTEDEVAIEAPRRGER